MKSKKTVSVDLETIIPILIGVWRRFSKLSGPSDKLQTREFRGVVEGVKALAQGFDGEESLIGHDYFKKDSLLGSYLLYQWVVHYQQALSILGELPSTPKRVLDLCSGPAPASFAALRLGSSEVFALDQNETALRLGAEVCGRYGLPLNIRKWKYSPNNLPVEGKFDLIIVSHCLEELFPSSRDNWKDKQKDFIHSLLGKLTPNGHLVIIDNSYTEMNRRILSLRDHLVEQGVPVLAPCIWKGSCPALQTANSPCYAQREFAKPFLIKEIQRAAQINLSSLKMTYIIFKNPQAESIPLPAYNIYRVISPPIESFHGKRFYLCGTDGKKNLGSHLSEPHPLESKAFEYLRRGEAISIKNGLEKNQLIDIIQDTQINIERLAVNLYQIIMSKIVSDSTGDLQKALEKIEQFTNHYEIYKVKTSPLFAKISNLFSDRPALNEILEAVETVKKHTIFFERLSKGSQAHQKLADAAIQTIHRYNTLLQKKLPPNWSRRILNFLFQIPDSLLPIEGPTYAKSETGNIEKLSSLVNPLNNVSPQEADALRMKAITLLQKQGIQLTSCNIQESPIQSSHSSHDVVSLFQTLESLPGEIIELQGSFRRTKQISIPIPESFQVSSKSIQTAFPRPQQHTLWALSYLLIPPCPLKLSRMHLFSQVHAQKKKIAEALLPTGQYVSRAKKLIKQKQETFTKNKEWVLDQHQNLAQAIRSSAGLNNHSAVDQFFADLKGHSEVFDFLSSTYNQISKNYIETPHENFQQTWIERNEVQYLVPSHPENNFSNILGNILGQSSRKIILQYYSELFHFPIPPFNDFDKRIQFSVYKQLFEFFDGLENDQNQLLKQLESDIAVFTTTSLEDLDPKIFDLIHELEHYYQNNWAIVANK